MKCVVLIISFIASLNICNAQTWAEVPERTSREGSGLKGEVNTVKEYSYQIGADSSKEKISEKILVFNEDGFLTDETSISFDRKGRPIQNRKHIYYAEGKPVAISSYIDDDLTDSVSLRYNRQGQLKQRFVYRKGDDLYERTSYTYRQNDLVTIRKKNAGNRIEQMMKIAYKPDGREMTILNDQLHTTGRKEIVTEKKSNGNVNTITYIYNANDSCTSMHSRLKDSGGHLLEEVMMNGNKQVEVYKIYTYNENEREKAHVYSGEEEQNITYTYQYDRQGNIIHTATYIDGKLSEELHRDIIYYPEEG